MPGDRANVRVDFVYGDVMKQEGWVSEATLLLVNTNLSPTDMGTIRLRANGMKASTSPPAPSEAPLRHARRVTKRPRIARGSWCRIRPRGPQRPLPSRLTARVLAALLLRDTLGMFRSTGIPIQHLSGMIQMSLRVFHAQIIADKLRMGAWLEC